MENLEIITGSLCLDMATLSIGADLWSHMTLMKVKQRKLTTGKEFWEISFEDGYIMLVAFRRSLKIYSIYM